MISFRLRSSTSWADTGHEISWIQHRLGSHGSIAISRKPISQARDLQRRPSDMGRVFGNSDFEVRFDRARGCLKSWVIHGSELLDTDPTIQAALIPSFWRCPTDND